MAEPTLEQRVAELEHELRTRIASVARLNDAETAEIKADIATLRASMIKGFSDVHARLEAFERKTEQRFTALETVVAEMLSETERRLLTALEALKPHRG